MISNFVSFKVIMNKIYRDLRLTEEISESDVIEWCAEVLSKIGAYGQYKQVKTCLELNDGKAMLPIDFHKMIDISFKSKPLSWANPSMYTRYGCEGTTIPDCCTLHKFYIENNYLITDILNTEVNSEGESALCLIYLGVVVDEEGYPMIPDDPYFKEACVKYVTYMLDYQEWRKGNVPKAVMDKSETDYLWYIGAANGSANMPNVSQMENLLNTWVRLIPRQHEYYNNFQNLNKPEARRRF